MLSYKAVIREAELKLEEAQLSMQLAKLFMLEIAGMQSVDLYVSYEDEMPIKLYDIFMEGLARLLMGEPMQYILGYEWFYGRKFSVSRDCLIPRPETEELVSYVLSRCDDLFEDKEKISLADIGCGSGAIGLSLKAEEPKVNVVLSDISEEALAIAKSNASLLDVEAHFLKGSMLDPIIEAKIKLDVIVCNPPYIPASQAIEHSVKDFEPHVALFGGEDGLMFYRMVFDRCLEVLNPKGFMAFEIGFDQKDALLMEANKRFKNAKIEVLKDMYQKDRMLFIEFE